MKKAILIILLSLNALMLCARSSHSGVCTMYECRDTVIQKDTVWVRTVSHASRPVLPDPVSEDSFERGIGKATTLFVPKGTLSFGLTASYNSYDLGASDADAGYKMLFSLIDGLDGNVTACGVAPQISYFIADNTSVGLRFDYAKTSLELDSASMSLGDLMSFDINDMYYMKQAYSGSLTLRHYMSIADSKRFAIFVEGRGTYGYAQSKSWKLQDGEKYGTYQDIYDISLSIVPGVVCFIMDNAAFEVSIGVLGFDTQRVKQVTNQVEYSELRSSGANFKINLLSINFGTSFYIYPRKSKDR